MFQTNNEIMIILSHRGYWNQSRPKNSLCAFETSFDLGFGTETDFRDCGGELVISHDPALEGALLADEFFLALSARDKTLPIAINIKADGLQSLLKQSLEKHQLENYFLFDMSIPDAMVSLRHGLRIFTRHSDVETEPHLYHEAAGIWMDAFRDDRWLTPEAIARHLDAGKKVCLVSPELHGRPHLPFWERLHSSGIHEHPRLMLCSDIPESAKLFFQP
jgi:glycerophosphoryl diester phosphodiesterase